MPESTGKGGWDVKMLMVVFGLFLTVSGYVFIAGQKDATRVEKLNRLEQESVDYEKRIRQLESDNALRLVLETRLDGFEATLRRIESAL